MKPCILPVLVAIILVLSGCVSSNTLSENRPAPQADETSEKSPGAETAETIDQRPKEEPFFQDGLYLYNFEKATTSPEQEAQYAQSGILLKQSTINIYDNVVVAVKAGQFTDPVSMLHFTVAEDGSMRCSETPSITGKLQEDGSFLWGGYLEQFDSLYKVEVEGSLQLVKENLRASSGYNGVYHITESMGDKALEATVKDGYLIYRPINPEEADETFQGWPTLVHPDGSFSSKLEIIVRTEMGYSLTGDGENMQTQSADNTTYIISEGHVDPSEGLVLNYAASFNTAIDDTSGEGTRVYAGMKVGDAQLGNLDRSGYPAPMVKTAVQDGKAKTTAYYPDWYLSPPLLADKLTAAGARHLSDQEGALRSAETIAIGEMAFQLQVSLKSAVNRYFTEESSGEEHDSQESVEAITEQASQLQFDYAVIRSEYDQESQTAFVLISVDKAKAREQVRNFLEKQGLGDRSEEIVDTME
ncbi:hypothetical protein [Sediminispirochaeta bajacaliforniensis]|uniref:hypothetical protein n=1 Tax=Sediminispirochaeta bajacaliforniensis TaxID=148 RepID=UPI0003750DAA|nr:hypothetical protein [Sediminispirochaeta bajacaliforniensis]